MLMIIQEKMKGLILYIESTLEFLTKCGVATATRANYTGFCIGCNYSFIVFKVFPHPVTGSMVVHPK